MLAKLDVSEWCEKVEIAGAGFLNFRLKTAALAQTLRSRRARRAFVFRQRRRSRERVVIDFSSPNVAKPMHVGHIRSTILGDSLARTLRLLGHRVITDNHIGDWGTQFGKLLAGLETASEPRRRSSAIPLAKWNGFTRWSTPPAKRIQQSWKQPRQELVKLQSGDEENLRSGAR